MAEVFQQKWPRPVSMRTEICFTDSEIDSDDSYVPENVNILPPILDDEVDVDSQPEDEGDELLWTSQSHSLFLTLLTKT